MSTIVITKLTNGLKVKEGTRKAYTLVGKPDSITPKDGVVSIWLNKTEYLYAIADTITFDGVAFSGTEEDLADSFRTAFNLNSTSVTSNVNGQATMANSAPVAIASNQSVIPVKPDVQTATGNITTQNLVPSGTATAASAVEVALNGCNGLGIQVTGTYTGALSVQGTLNGTTWFTLTNSIADLVNGTRVSSITSANTGIYQVNVSGLFKVRVTALGAVTGTAAVTMITTDNSGIFFLDDRSTSLRAIQDVFGSAIKGLPLGVDLFSMSSSLALTDGTINGTPFYFPRAGVITGVKFLTLTQGVFTGDNFNGLALYTISGGTMTQVAITANDETIWKATSNTLKTVALTSPYTAAAGFYFWMSLYNSSAQTTAPSVAANPSTSASGLASFDYANSIKSHWQLTAQTALPSSQAMSGVSVSNARLGFFPY